MMPIRTIAAVAAMIGMNVSAPAQAYSYEQWARLWEETCGSIDAAYSVVDDPEAHGWINADASSDEMAARIVETARMSAQGSAQDAKLTGLFVLRQANAATNALVAFQEMQLVDEPNTYLLGCTLYDPNAPEMGPSDLSRFSTERPFVDASNNGLAVIEWPESAEGSGRLKMTAGSIPADHPGASLLLGGLVLKTQFVFTEDKE